MAPEFLVISGTMDTQRLKTDLLKASDARYQKYLTWLKRQPLAEQTRRAYQSRINHFLGFLGASGEDLRPLVQNERERTHVLREYKRHLKQELKSRPATVNAYLTAIDHFFQFLGTERSKVPREDLPQEAPRALTKEEQKRFLRAVVACRRSKDRAVALLLFYTGIRISECAALNEHDVSVAGRKNRIIVRSGKGDRYREIPLNAEAREALSKWISERNEKFENKNTDDALFLNPQGKRLTTASLDLIVRKIGQSCGVPISAHVLRHTCLTNLVRNGNDLIVVAEIGGHKRLETTRRYTLPTLSDKERAVEGL
jgi:site-specific recombinase XerD